MTKHDLINLRQIWLARHVDLLGHFLEVAPSD